MKTVKKIISKLISKVDPFGYIASDILSNEIKAEYAGATFVNVKGIINSCTIFNQNQKADADWIDFNLSDQTKENLSIYINTDSISRFINEILPSITHTFVLVVGNSDLTFGSKNFSTAQLEVLLENRYLKVLFAQNLDFVHSKVIPLPIGMDYHNVWEKPAKNSLGYRITPLLHERMLTRILREAPMIVKRQNLLYCNWHFKLDRGDRKDCLEKIDRSLCYFEKQPVDRLQNYKNQSQFRYVLSPSGLGIDCYRTWEAICLGCIPVVKKSLLFSHFENLPIISVNDWSEVTADFLEHSFENLINKEIDYKVIFMKYWQEAIRTGCLPLMADEYKMKLSDLRSNFINL